MKYAFAASAILAAGAVAQSDLTCAGTGVTVAPTAVEYPVYISTYISAATVFNINGNANITINNAPTTLEIYTTGTSTVYSTVTDTTTTTALASATPTPTAITVDEPIILAINDAALKHKRQSGATGFLGGSAGVAATCGEAVTLTLTDGSLFVNSTGEQFSTTPGVTQADFAAGGSVGSITTTFGLNNGFVWDNSAFVGGSATFCINAGGLVQALFSNSTPADCTSISFTAILASSCTNTTTSSSSSSSSSTSSSATSSASVNATSASIASSVSSSVSSVSSSLSSVISSIESSASSAAANATSAAASISSAASAAESSASAAASSATAAASSTTTAVTTSVQVSFASATAASKNKRQDTTEYLLADGTFTSDATLAATFDLVDGQFFSGDLQFSTDADTDYAVFAASDTVGDITYTFDLASGALTWTNGSFNIDDANTVVFAVSSSTLYAAFQTIPPGATTVALSATTVGSSTVIASDSTSSTSSSSTVASTTSSSTTSSSTSASTTSSSSSSSSSSVASTTSSSSSSSSTSSSVSATASVTSNSTLKGKRYNGMARLHPRN